MQTCGGLVSDGGNKFGGLIIIRQINKIFPLYGMPLTSDHYFPYGHFGFLMTPYNFILVTCLCVYAIYTVTCALPSHKFTHNILLLHLR